MNDFFANLEKENKILVFGHRGLSEYYPENTMLAFSKCAENPLIDGIELDVHLCKSGEVVVAHDFSLKRISGIDREIEDMTLSELKDIDVGSFKSPEFSFCRIPLLSEVLSTFKNRFIYDIELKVKAGKINKELSKKVYNIICNLGLKDNVLISSFNPFALRAFRSVCKAKMNCADIFTISKDIPKILWEGKGHMVSLSTYLKPGLEVLDKIFVERHRSLPIIAWTVNSEEDAKRLLDFNKEGAMRVFGMIGNDPLMLSNFVNSYKQIN